MLNFKTPSNVFIKRSGIVLAALAVLIIALACFYHTGILGGNSSADVAASAPAKRSLPVYCVETADKKLAISFDAAWGDEFTQEILKILARYDIKATFFVVGFWAEKYPEDMKAIAMAGHEIGSHSNTHPHMNKLSNSQIIDEMSKAQSKINATALSGAVMLFRFPFGEYESRTVDCLKEMGYTPVQWDVDSLDWKEEGSEAIIKRVTTKVKPGSIVLFHNNGKYTTKALPVIIDDLLGKGYSFVKISDLLIKEPWYIDSNGRQRPSPAS